MRTTWLTTGVDNKTGTANDDTFTADNTAETQLSVADVINGGAGNDTLKVYADGNPGFTIGENITNIENLYVNGQSGDLTLTNNGFTSIEIDSATTTAAGADTLTIAAGQTITLDSVVDGDLTDDGNNKGEIEITGATAVTSASLVLDGVGASTLTSANDDLDIDVTSASITSLSIKSQGTTLATGGSTR